MQPGEEVQVKSRDTHDGVVSICLITNSEVGEGVPSIGKVVVAGMQGFEEKRGGGEERHVLDVRVVFWVVGHEVMDVVARLPPPN